MLNYKDLPTTGTKYVDDEIFTLFGEDTIDLDVKYYKKTINVEEDPDNTETPLSEEEGGDESEGDDKKEPEEPSLADNGMYVLSFNFKGCKLYHSRGIASEPITLLDGEHFVVFPGEFAYFSRNASDVQDEDPSTGDVYNTYKIVPSFINDTMHPLIKNFTRDCKVWPVKASLKYIDSINIKDVFCINYKDSYYITPSLLNCLISSSLSGMKLLTDWNKAGDVILSQTGLSALLGVELRNNIIKIDSSVDKVYNGDFSHISEFKVGENVIKYVYDALDINTNNVNINTNNPTGVVNILGQEVNIGNRYVNTNVNIIGILSSSDIICKRLSFPETASEKVTSIWAGICRVSGYNKYRAHIQCNGEWYSWNVDNDRN